MNLTVDIKETGQDELERLGLALLHAKANPVLGRAAVNTFRDHFFELNRQRANQLGGRRTNFYAQAARSTHFETSGDAITIATNQVGIRLRRYGGTVRPKNSNWLTIPIRSEAYGKRAREFNDLRFVFANPQTAYLVKAERTEVSFRKSKRGKTKVVRGKEIGGEALYVLKKSVTQRPDASVFPTEAKLNRSLVEAANEYLRRQGGRA